MVIYGVALLAFCMLIGVIVGNLLGTLLGVSADVGGVGFAMLLLIFSSAFLEKKNILKPDMRQGVTFWAAMYIPIVVAMGATQNVVKALSGSFAAIVTGVLVTVVSMSLVPLVSRLGGKPQALPPIEKTDGFVEPILQDHPISHLNPLIKDKK